MSFFRDLKSLLTTGSRAPSDEGMADADDAETATVDAEAGTLGNAPVNWVPSQQDDRPRH